jgi:branched-chain amino acid transport system ATP-binding protein
MSHEAYNAATDPMLRVEDVQVNYGDFIAVNGASLTVREGEIVSVVGTNGAGKSTLFDCVAGVVKPHRGKIWFKDEEITGLPAHEIVSRGLTLVPQGSRCFVRMTVEENLFMGSYIKKARAAYKDTLKKVYELFPVLYDKRADLSGSLSGGQRQMVAIGRALMNQPEMVLFDEISLGLAPTVIKDIYARIKEINREGVTAVLIEQDVKRSLRTSTHCDVMLKGRVVLSGSSAELTEEQIKAAYFGV